MRGRRDGGVPCFQSLKVPAAIEQFPSDLKCNECLARAGGEREQDSLAVVRDGFRYAIDGDVLVVAAGVEASFVFEGNGSEAVAPCVGFGEGQIPEFVGRWIGRNRPFLASLGVHTVDALAVGAVGVADGHLFRVVLGLRQTFGERLVPRFGLDDGELGIAVFEDVIRAERVAVPDISGDTAFDATGRNPVVTPDAAAVGHAPSCRFQRGIDVLGSGFGFVHFFFPLICF